MFDEILEDYVYSSLIWLWLSCPYDFLVDFLSRDNFINNNLPSTKKALSFAIVVLAYSSIGLLITSSIGLLMTRVKRKRDTSEASILALIFGYPMVISFGYLAIVAIVYFPISVASTLIGRL